MHFVETVSVVIPCVLTLTMANSPMFITPFRKSKVDVVLAVSLTRKNSRSGSDRRFHYRSNCFLLNIRQHPHHDLTSPLNHSKDGRLFFLQRAAATRPLQTPATALTSFFFTASGWPLWPATTYTSSHSTSPSRTNGC